MYTHTHSFALMHIHAHACTRTCIQVHTYICMHTHSCTRMHTRICTHRHCVYTHTHADRCVHIHTQGHMCTSIHRYIHMNTGAHMHIHTHTHTCSYEGELTTRNMVWGTVATPGRSEFCSQNKRKFTHLGKQQMTHQACTRDRWLDGSYCDSRQILGLAKDRLYFRHPRTLFALFKFAMQQMLAFLPLLLSSSTIGVQCPGLASVFHL